MNFWSHIFHSLLVACIFAAALVTYSSDSYMWSVAVYFCGVFIMGIREDYLEGCKNEIE